MGKYLSDNITVVISCTDALSREIVRCLLAEKATVAVIAGSTQELGRLNQHLSLVSSKKLLTFLTDPLDYIKCLDILAHLKEMYGGIDLVVTELANFCPLVEFTHVELSDWQNVTEHNINFYFTNRLILTCLKDETSMYLTIGKHNQLYIDNQNNITDLITSIGFEITSIISSEFAGVKARYHHLFLNSDDPDECNTNPPEKEVAENIIKLYINNAGNNGPAMNNSVPNARNPFEEFIRKINI